MTTAMTIEPDELRAGHQAVLFDCRFSLADPEAGRRHYLEGHIPGAHFLDLNRDLSSPVERHGGRHPLPGPQRLAALFMANGVNAEHWWAKGSGDQMELVISNRGTRERGDGAQADVAESGEEQATSPRSPAATA